MPGFVNPDVEAYAEAHTTPPTDVLRELIDETRAMGQIAGMMTGPVEGRFLEFLVFALRPKVVVEIGTFTGYSSISMATALAKGSGAKVVACDVNPDTHATAERYATAAGVVDRIDYRLGDARETIAGLEGPFDLVFIDADKENYANYYEAVLPKLADTGIIAVDNTLWSGRVLDGNDDSSATVALRAFNDMILADERVVCVQLTVRDGITLIRRR
jgi:caffeoyl-CoA O-methyltransferase